MGLQLDTKEEWPIFSLGEWVCAADLSILHYFKVTGWEINGNQAGEFFLSYPTWDALFKIIQIGSEFLANGAVAAIKFPDGEFITLAFY